MAVTCALLWIIFSLSEAAITSTPNSMSECNSMSTNLKWVYEESNILVVEWNFNGNLMLQYIPSQTPPNDLQYASGYTSAKVGHISNGEINISSLTTSDSGSYSCKTTYSLGSPLTFETQMTLTVSDMISTNLTCSYNQSADIIDCSVIPSSITSVTINGHDHLTSSLPINGTGSKTYSVCMAGEASNCRNDGIQQCITVEGESIWFVIIVATAGIVIAILVCVIVVCCGTSDSVKHIYRRYKRKSLKDYARSLSKTIMACHGDEIIVTVSHRFSIIEGNKENVQIYPNDTASTLHIKDITEQHVGVYKCGILLESIDSCKEVTFDYKVIQKKDESGNGDSSTEVSVEEQTRKEIKIEIHFEVDNEDLVTFREPRSYYFADKYNIRGVTFTGIQIIVLAAIYQLISMISTPIVLTVVYYEHKEYDTLVAIPVAVTIAVLFPLLGIGVYILTVLCCRKLKKDTTNDLKTGPRCVKLGLLLFITIFPIAWLVLFVMVFVNKCKQSPNDGNDDKTKENQSTVEETTENHTNGIRLSLLSTACCQNSVDAKEDAKQAVPLPSKSIWDNKRKAELTSITVDAKAIKNGKQISKKNETENQAESHHVEK